LDAVSTPNLESFAWLFDTKKIGSAIDHFCAAEVHSLPGVASLNLTVVFKEESSHGFI